jgi:hypothetical protein
MVLNIPIKARLLSVAAAQVWCLTTGDEDHAMTRLSPPNDGGKFSRSPVCWAGQAEGTYMGYLSRDELIAFLNELLEAERAGSRVTLESAVQASDPATKSLLGAIQRDEAKWCGVLMKAIHAAEGEASKQTGAFHAKAMAIADLSERMAFLNRGQGWVVRKLRETLPKIRDDALHQDLSEMLSRHEQNILLAEAHLRKET